MNLRPLLAIATCTLLSLSAAVAHAQDDEEPRSRASQILSEARAHYESGRKALAAESYLELYAALVEAQNPRAPIALWNAGNALADVPGRETDAIGHLRRFLEESTPLVEDPDVRDWRSEAVSLIDELEARLPDPDLAPTEGEPPQPAESTEPDEPSSGGISPIGPVVLGIGGAVLVSGLIVAAVGLVQNQELIDRCPTTMDCDPATESTMESEVNATRALGLAGDVLWIAGATVALTGLVLTFTLEGESDNARVQLQGRPGGGTLAFTGSFQ